MKDLTKHLTDNKALIKIKSVEECFRVFGYGENLSSPFLYFRGHSNSSYQLLSTLDRFENNEWGSKEKLLLRQFKKIAGNFISSELLPNTTFEWLSLMQHYGIPTRLLDLTTSPYVALYFAVNDWDNYSDCAVWAINPYGLHEASLHRLRNSDFPLSLPEKYGNSYHLPQFINEGYFSETFLTGKYRVCMIIEPEKAERRLFQQQGAFLVTSGLGVLTEEILLEVLFDKSHKDPKELEFEKRSSLDWGLVKVVIPGELKKRIFNQLLNMNINASTLFPDLFGAAKHVTEFVKSSDFIGNRWNLKNK